jgi:hypothetical protein
MPKVGRNDPCPCGSGKKYKCCCGQNNNILPFQASEQEKYDSNTAFSNYRELLENGEGSNPPTFMEILGTPNKATKIIKALQKELEGKDFSSNEETDQFVKDYYNNINKKSVDDFLGLTPEQMYRIHYKTFEANADIVTLSVNINEKEIEDIPILLKIKYFIEELQKLEPLKATQKGNLPRKFVQDLDKNVYKKYEGFDFKPHKEEDEPLINSHRHLLSMAGLVKKNKNYFSLTEKAKTIIKNKDFNKLYEIIFKTYVQKYNWCFLDGYNEFPLIQTSVIFNLYILKNKAKNYIEGKRLGDIFLKAFPDLTRESTSTWKEPKQEIIDCFELRFLKRFCIPFGFVTEKKEGDNLSNRKFYYKTTALFDRFLMWRI